MPMNLSQRQQQILIAVIEEYVKSADPVGSEELMREYNLPISSATIRGEMVELEKEGYLYQPHVSAGRMPTDKGYRFFVNHVTEKKLQRMNFEEQKRLEEELLKLRLREKMLARTLAKLLASFSNNLAITGLLEEKEFFESGIKQLISQPDFQNIDEICQVAEMLDYLDENITELAKELQPKKVKTFIGKENLFTESGDCAIVISQCILPSGGRGILAILGPKRMEYRKNISIIEQVSDFLGRKRN
jgi:heat-inducible transcriptional repressor